MSTTRSTTCIEGNGLPGWRVAAPVVAGVALALLSAVAQADIAPARQQELRQLLQHDCGSCHGMTLQGGLGPALTPQALQGRPREALVATVLHGRPGTPMPPWAGLLSAEEAGWLVDALLKGGVGAPR